MPAESVAETATLNHVGASRFKSFRVKVDQTEYGFCELKVIVIAKLTDVALSHTEQRKGII